MAEQEEYITLLMKSLELVLRQSGQRTEAAVVARVTDGIEKGGTLLPALEELYGVSGFDQMALRLMWYAERMQEWRGPRPDQRVLEFQVQQLASDLPIPTGSGKEQPAVEQEVRHTGAGDAVQRFSDSINALRKRAFEGDRFVGLDTVGLDGSVRAAEQLRAAANAESNQEVARFADAYMRFARYILENRVMTDVRVVNFIENANLTLQTAIATFGPDDFDSLHQTTMLLEAPKTLLETPTKAKE